jgi:hypothetical protein
MRFLTYENLDARGLKAKVTKVREAIERDDFRSPDVKKLTGSGYYRARLDDSARLLLSFVEFRGHKACLALEVIPNHAYEKSRFLRGARVEEASLVEVTGPAEVEAPPIRHLHPTRATFSHLDKPLSFDDAQDEVLRRPLPMVLVGSAGSGKTALMVQRLRSESGRVAYVTESSWLAQLARDLYVSCGFDPGDQEADFLSYRQLLETVEVPRGRPVLFRDFAAFFERHRQKVRFADAHQCFEELRGVLTAEPEGPLSLDGYLALGVRHSIFTPEQRAAIHPLFVAWRTWMAEKALYEPNLVAHACLDRMEARYDFVAVDEVQDLTNVQLTLVLRSLKPDGRFLVAGDANQVVHPNFFSWAKVKSLFWRGVGLDEARHLTLLTMGYRNSRRVTEVANALLKVKHARFGSVDRESTVLMRTADTEEGGVSCFATKSPAVAELDAKTRRSTKVAVIVLRDEHKAEARARFRTPLVFSVLESKGLEYESVILFRFLASERSTFTELCEGVREEDLRVEELEYRRAKDKGDRSLETYKFFVNALYVALTRAVRTAYLVEDDPAHPLLGLLGVRHEGSAAGVQDQKGTVEDWQREAHRLEQHGKQEQVEAIRRSVLRIETVPWKVLEGEALREVARTALDPKGVSSKARKQLLEFCLFHGEWTPALLAQRLLSPARDLSEEQVAAVRRRMLEGYEGRNLRPVLEKVDRYGVDFRNPHGLTPLMLAASAGNLPLLRELLDRGASREARNHVGYAAMHWALARAYDDEAFARGEFGVLYDALAPASFDLMVDGRLLQVGREQGEYFTLQACIASLPLLYRARLGRFEGLRPALLERGAFADFPEVVVREARRKHTYMNHLFARNEAEGTYTPNRRLWVRERHGHYMLNPHVSLKVQAGDGAESWVPLTELVGLAWHESHVSRRPGPLRTFEDPSEEVFDW